MTDGAYYIWFAPAVVWGLLAYWNARATERGKRAEEARRLEWQELRACIAEHEHWRRYGRGRPYRYANQADLLRAVYGGDADAIERAIKMTEYDVPSSWHIMRGKWFVEKYRKPEYPQILVP